MIAPTPVSDDEMLLRHIPPGTTFQAPGPRITSKNFVLRPGEIDHSVSRASMTSPTELMARLGDPAAGSRIATATASDIRALGLDIVHTPRDDDTGHSDIVSAASDLTELAVARSLAKLFQLLPTGP